MITNKGRALSIGTLEWNFPVLYEGQKISLPIVLRPLVPNDEAYGIMEVTYGSCEDGPEVIEEPILVYDSKPETTF